MATDWKEVNRQKDYERAKNWTGVGKAPNDGGYYAEQAAIKAANAKAAAEAAKQTSRSSSPASRSSAPSAPVSSGQKTVGGIYQAPTGVSNISSPSGLGFSSGISDLESTQRNQKEQLEDSRLANQEQLEDSRIAFQDGQDARSDRFSAAEAQRNFKDNIYNAYARMLVSHYG